MWVDRAGVRLWAEISGTGPTVVLQTGGAGAGTMWREYLPLLDGFRVVRLDHRGRGRSSRPATVQQHAMPEYVADVVAVADAVGADRFGFVGYSMGAQVGYALATDHPRRVASLVALGGPWEQEPEGSEPDELVDLLRSTGMSALCSAVETDEGLPLPLWLREEFLGTDAEQFALSLEAWSAWSAWPRLGDIACPTALVAGELEDPDRGNLAWARRITAPRRGAPPAPPVTTTWLSGLGHVGAFLDADRNARAWLDTLRHGLGDG